MQGAAAIAMARDAGDVSSSTAIVRLKPVEVPALYLVAIALLAGDTAGYLRIGPSFWLAVFFAVGTIAAWLLASHVWTLAMALGAIATAGSIAAQSVYAPPLANATVRAFSDNQPIAFEGSLDREPETVRDVVRLYLRVERAGIGDGALVPATGRIRITVLHSDRYRIGDRLRVHSRIRFPRNYGDPDEFNYEAYMARERIAATALVSHPEQIQRIGYRRPWFWGSIEAIRQRIGAFIDSGLDYPERAEMRALIIGDRGAIDQHLRDVFALTGMAHMLVISGLHLGFVASVAFVLMRLCCLPFPRLMILGYANKLAAIASGIAVLAYSAVAGTHVSTLRALIMVLCYVAAVLADRGREVVASLALAALIICFVLPGSSMDVGFQLSFVAVLGIMLGMSRYSVRWEIARERVAGTRGEVVYLAGGALIGYLAVSFFALIATAPLTTFYFNQFSLIGLIANPVVVPVMAMGGMMLGLFAAVLSFVCRPAAELMLHGAGRALALGNQLAEAFVRLPGAWVRIFTPSWFEIALVYGLLALWLCAPIRDSRRPSPPGAHSASPRLPWRKLLASLAIAALTVDTAWWLHERYFNPRWRVTFLSVGQGDAAVIRFPGSAVMLIDAGAAFRDGSNMGERVVAPFLWSQKIMRVNYLVLSHPEIDHFGGFIFIARNFHPGEFWTTGADSPDVTYQELLDTLAQAHTATRQVDASTPVRLIGGVSIRCLSPEPGSVASRNNNSMVIDLGSRGVGFLFTGDLESKGEQLLIQRDLSLHNTVLKVPHHGSITSSSPRFVEAVRPSFAVISDGYDNRYHFPAGAVVARYQSDGATVLRTDQMGAIGFEAMDGQLHLWTGMSIKP